MQYSGGVFKKLKGVFIILTRGMQKWLELCIKVGLQCHPVVSISEVEVRWSYESDVLVRSMAYRE